MMLQQTQVDRVLLFYPRWLKQFPTWEQLAQATTSQIIYAWAGLGYNRRALQLKEIAVIVKRDGVPAHEKDWRALKGIGPYTAAAISVFAQHKRTLPIDTNIRRVLARVLLGLPYSELKDEERIREAAEPFLPTRGAFYDVPQALFDLAESVCTKVPNCARCPLQKDCLSAKKFLSKTVIVPKQMIKKPIEKRHPGKSFPDRIYRGRILKLVRDQKNITLKNIGPSIDKTYDSRKDAAWVQVMVGRLVKEGFLSQKNNRLTIRNG